MKRVLTSPWASLVLICLLVAGCAGTTTETGSRNKEERKYDIALNNCKDVSMNLYLDRTSTLDSTSKSEGGEVTTKPVTDLALEQTDNIDNPGNIVVPKPETPDDADEPAEPTEPDEPINYGELTRFQEWRGGTVYEGDDILMTCPSDFIYEDCWRDGSKMKEGDDKGRQFFSIKSKGATSEVICELKAGGYVKATLTYGDKGSC